MKNKKGFTLSEMLVVIVIIAIIAVIAIPSLIVANKNINRRLLNSKKEHIVTAAELYGTDNPDIFNGRAEVKVYVSELIDYNYLEKEVDLSEEGCQDITETNNSTIGCIINPVDKSSMNQEYVILRREAVGVVGEYEGPEDPADSDDDTLVAVVCRRLKEDIFNGVDANGDACTCEDIESGKVEACLISGGSDVNNYLRYENVMWRVIGIYDIYGDNTQLSAKMINDDNIEIIVE